jgi:hypothetical protein
MTDNELFQEWWKENGKSLIKAQPDYRGTAFAGFLAALAIGREEGRKERTVEIEKQLHIAMDYGKLRVRKLYPECFMKAAIREEAERL